MNVIRAFLLSFLFINSSGYAEDLQLSSGEQYTYLTQLGVNQDSRFARRLFSSVREIINRPSYPCRGDIGYQAWILSEYDFANVNKSRNVGSLIDNSFDLSGGVHTYMFTNTILGIAGNYSEDSIRYSHVSRSRRLQCGQVAIYGAYKSSCFYVLSDLIIGETRSNHYKREAFVENLLYSSLNTPILYHGRGHIELGLKLPILQLDVQPFFGAVGGWYTLRKIDETGRGPRNLSINKRSDSYWDTMLGLHLFGEGRWFNFGGDLYWQHRFDSFDHDLSIKIANLGPRFIFQGSRFGSDGAVGALFCSMNLNRCLQAYAEINGQYWDLFQSAGATFGINYRW